MTVYIGILIKLLGFALNWVNANNESKKALIELSKKLSNEGNLSTNVHDKMKAKWDRINAEMEKANDN